MLLYIDSFLLCNGVCSTLKIKFHNPSLNEMETSDRWQPNGWCSLPNVDELSCLLIILPPPSYQPLQSGLASESMAGNVPERPSLWKSTWYHSPSLTFLSIALVLVVPEPMSSSRYRWPSSISMAKKSTCTANTLASVICKKQGHSLLAEY